MKVLILGCSNFAYIFFSLQSEKVIGRFSLIFALSENERRTLIDMWASGTVDDNKLRMD
jgi:hypothetical protein